MSCQVVPGDCPLKLARRVNAPVAAGLEACTHESLDRTVVALGTVRGHGQPRGPWHSHRSGLVRVTPAPYAVCWCWQTLSGCGSLADFLRTATGSKPTVRPAGVCDGVKHKAAPARCVRPTPNGRAVQISIVRSARGRQQRPRLGLDGPASIETSVTLLESNCVWVAVDVPKATGGTQLPQPCCFMSLVQAQYRPHT